MLIAKTENFPIECSTFFVVDDSIEPPEPFDWKNHDWLRGGIYTDSYIHLSAMTSYADAQVQIFLEEYESKPEYQWVVQLPLVLSQGKLAVRAVNCFDLTAQLEPGNYKVVVAQTVLFDDDETEGTVELIDIYLQPTTTLLQESSTLYIDPEFKNEISTWT